MYKSIPKDKTRNSLVYTDIPTLKSTDVYDVKCIKHAPREQTSNQCTNNNAIAQEEYTIDQALV